MSRYTHRVAISDHRLVDVTDDHVTFTWKDYRDGSRIALMTLTPAEFIRRFLLSTTQSSPMREIGEELQLLVLVGGKKLSQKYSPEQAGEDALGGGSTQAGRRSTSVHPC